MNIEEARNVLWLKSNHRRLGELLDEGYLTRERLEWAAQSAHDPQLQQAARVILESVFFSSALAEVEELSKARENREKDPGLPLHISLESAYATVWPFPPFEGQPMGALVESKQISLKDLAYAIENAVDANVRKAASAFSLIRLNQLVNEPVPAVGYVRVAAGSNRRAQREQLRLALRRGLGLGILTAIAVVLLIGLAILLFRSYPNIRSLIRFLAALTQTTGFYIGLGVFLLTTWLIASTPGRTIRKLDGQLEAHRRDREEQEKVVQTIVQTLDGTWHLFRNVSLPGRDKGELDLVLVGPPGVWALEVSNLKGKYRNVGETWEQQRAKLWKPLPRNPGRQALNNALRLKTYLKAHRIDTVVESAVIWANEEGSLSVETPSVAIWRYHRLADELGNIWDGETLSKADQDKIVEKLTKLCERQKRL